MRGFPGLVFLSHQLRRPQIARLTIGLAMAVPALLLLSVTGFDAAPRAVKDTAVVDTFSSDPMAVRWRERVLDEEGRALVASLAESFDVPMQLAIQIHEAVVDVELDVSMVFGLVRAESSFRPRAVSPVGAVGLTQVMPATARDVEPGTSRSDLLNPETNLRIGFTYLRRLIRQYDGNEKLALTAYNRGPGTVDRVLQRGGDPDNGYAEKVLTGQSKRHVALMNAKFGRKRAKS